MASLSSSFLYTQSCKIHVNTLKCNLLNTVRVVQKVRRQLELLQNHNRYLLLTFIHLRSIDLSLLNAFLIFQSMQRTRNISRHMTFPVFFFFFFTFFHFFFHTAISNSSVLSNLYPCRLFFIVGNTQKS